SPTPLLAAAPHIPGGCGTRRGAGSRAAPPLRRAPLAAFIVGSSGPASFATGCSTQPEEVQMSPVHFHLLLNHVPVIGTLVAIALLAWALLRRHPELTRASLGMFVVFALAGIVVYLTGEPAEHLVEHLPGVSHDAVEAHEEAAVLATALLGGLGTLALGGLVAFRRALSVPRGVAGAALALSLLP